MQRQLGTTSEAASQVWKNVVNLTIQKDVLLHISVHSEVPLKEFAQSYFKR